MNKMFTDGGSRGNPGKAAGAYIIYNEKELIDIGGNFLGIVTNNFAEYSALFCGLKQASGLELKELECYLDSELVVKQLNGLYKIKDLTLKDFADKIFEIAKQFNKISFHYIPREKNKIADKLVNIILDSVSY